MGRWMPEDLDPTSLGGTARSTSNARMSMKSSALILIHSRQKKIIRTRYDQRKNRRLTPQVKIENRYKLEVHQ